MNHVGKRPTPLWPRLWRALDEAPEADRASLVVHHGARLLLLLATAWAVFVLFPAPRLPDTAALEVGVVAPHDVIAEFQFAIPKPDDDLLQQQAQAASGVPPVYDRSPAARDSMLAEVRSFFSGVDSLTGGEAEPARSALAAFLDGRRISPTPSTVDLLLDARQRATLRRSIESAVGQLFPLGVAPSSLGQGVAAVRVRGADGSEQLVPRDSLVTPDRFFQLAAQRLPEDAGPEAGELQRLILINLFRPSLVYNERQTEAARARARAAVDPVKAVVLEGEKIVGAHEQIGDREEERLRAYQAELSRRGMEAGPDVHSLSRAVGSVLYNALVLGIFGALLWFFRRTLYHDWRAVLLLAGLVLFVAAAGAVIARMQAPSELIPVTFAALIVAVLWDGRLGLSLALVLALLMGGQAPFLGLTAAFTTALGGAAAAFSVRMVQRRSKTWLYISIISLAYVAATATIGLMRSRDLHDIGWSMGYGIANAVVASLLAIGFLPLLESFTRITTDQTLLELSDLTRNALLKRLSLEAPGTYAHTVNVANLAEAAANSIGANALLARVGAYYHDIGKLVKPQYFIENQPRGRNPHDKLKPAMSSAIIRSHVPEGLRLAESDRLAEAVKRFIAEHHGTQQIAYFYNKAREMDPDAALNPTDFSYPGPKPQSRETAILMLADSVESAAHVLQDPTPARIRELVDRIVAGKLTDGQLDQSPLTLREIDLVKETLATVLTGMYHHRIDYPAAPGGPPAPEPLPTDPVAAGAPPVAQRG